MCLGRQISLEDVRDLVELTVDRMDVYHLARSLRPKLLSSH